MQYAEAKEIRDVLTNAHKDTVQLLNDLSGASRGQFGLTPDHIKQSHKWKTIYAFERAVFQNVRIANEYMVRNFSAEIKAERDSKRLTQTQL